MDLKPSFLCPPFFTSFPQTRRGPREATPTSCFPEAAKILVFPWEIHQRGAEVQALLVDLLGVFLLLLPLFEAPRVPLAGRSQAPPKRLTIERGQTSKPPASSRLPISQCYRNTLPKSEAHPNLSKLAIDDRSVLSDVISKSGFGHPTHNVHKIVIQFPGQPVEDIQVKLGVLDDVGAGGAALQGELDSGYFRINEELVKELEEQLKIAQLGERETAQARDKALKNITKWKGGYQNLESRHEKLKNDAEEVEGRYLKALNDLYILEQENGKLQEKVSAFSGENQSLQKENKAIQEQHNRMEQQVNQLQMQVDDLHEEKRGMKERYSWLEAEKIGLSGDNAQLRERVVGLEKENSKQQDQIKSVEGELKEESTSLREKNGSLKAELEERSTRLLRLQEERERHQEERNRHQRERDRLQGKRDVLQEERNGLLKQINELEAEKDVLFAVDWTSQEEQETLQKEKEALQGERDTLQGERDTLQGEITRLRRLSLATDGRTGVRKSRAHEGQAQSGRMMIVRSPRDGRAV